MSYTLECKFLKDTDAAVLVEDDNGEQHWIPLSQIERMVKRPNGYGHIVMSDWIAKQKGLG